jgi:hypothetical protein
MKLIETRFAYTWKDRGRRETLSGSYLGRKPATLATVRRFLRGNIRRYAPWLQLLDITVLGSSESCWRAK